MKPYDIKRIVHQYYVEVLNNTELWTARETAPRTEELQGKLSKAYALVIEDLKRDLALNRLSSMEDHADALISEKRLDIRKDSEEYKVLCREMLKADIEYFKTEGHRVEGDYSDDYDFLSPLVTSAFTEVAPADNSKKLSELITEYVRDKELKGTWRPRTKEENSRMYRLFIALLKISNGLDDIDVRSITRPLMQEYVGLLKRIPSNMNKLREFRGKSIVESMEIAEKTGAKLLDIRTRNKHIEEVCAVLGWGEKQGYLLKNPAECLLEKENKRQSEERDPYSKADLQKLFASPVYTSKIPLTRPERFFVPLIALFTGMRLEEMCQLYTEDVKKIEGVWCFDVNDAADKKLKNKSSIRIVPLHPILISVGLLEYVETRKKAKALRLWDLKKGRNGYSHMFGRWYGKYLRKHVTKNPKVVFHSFRHSFTDNLKQQGINESIISELVGHAQESITMSRYGKSYKPKVRLEAIQRLDFALNLSHLKFPA